MLSQTEKHQLKQYCDENPHLSILVQHLEDSHRMNLSRISHEIRNPVTIISSFLQLTQKTHPEVSNFGTWKPILENMEYLKQPPYRVLAKILPNCKSIAFGQNPN